MEKFVNIQSFVDTHEIPFMVIDKDYCILSVNKVFEETFNLTSEEIVRKKCYRVSHLKNYPCHEESEECPYYSVFHLRKPSLCEHTHYDKQGQLKRVIIRGYPIHGNNGEIYLGESIQIFASTYKDINKKEKRLVGNSPAFIRCMEQSQRAAQSEAPVLLIGETGTGKELAASFIHSNSNRSKRPFITIDCTILTESLFESEVFGHEHGSFTGATGRKTGLIELADGGTIFLDEISEMALPLQAKLLRALETGEFRRIGGDKTLKADIRIICATNRDLVRSVEKGQFRKDLYYRIAVFTIKIPPLRERLSDIPYISEELLNKFSQRDKINYQLTEDAVKYLTNHNLICHT